MTKIIKSLLAIVVISAVAGTATWAYFSDTETSEGNTFSAGTLIINDDSEAWMKNVTFDNIKPGDRVRKWVVLKNEGSLDIDFLDVTKQNVSDPSGMFSEVQVSATGKVAPDDPAYFTPDWTGGVTVDGWFDDSDMLDVSYYRTPAEVIHPGESYTMTFDFIFPTTMGNEFQGQTASFDMLFYAEQTH